VRSNFKAEAQQTLSIPTDRRVAFG